MGYPGVTRPGWKLRILMAETDENPWPSGLFAEYTHFDFFDHPNIQKQAVQNPL